MMTRTIPAETLVDRLRQRADSTAGIVHIEPDGTASQQPYAALAEEAAAVAGALAADGVHQGDRVMVLLGRTSEYLPVLWGCLISGVVPTLLTMPAALLEHNEPSRRIRHVWQLLGQPLVVLPDAAAERVADQATGLLPGLRTTTADRLKQGDPLQQWPTVTADDVALLQFSSGSTGHPKGVRLRHRNLAASLEASSLRTGASHRDTWVSWLPDSHDMGLIGTHLWPLWAGGQQVKMAPSHFLRAPRLWLALIEQHRGSLLFSPDFALRYLLEKVLPVDDIDLSSVRLLMDGAEPISVPTMRRFLRATASLGMRATMFSPVYGLAEATLGVTCPLLLTTPRTVQLARESLHSGHAVPATDAGAVEFACLGPPLPWLQVRIADDDDAPCDGGRIGHVQVRGPATTDGYEGGDTADSELRTEDGWLRTGDLGFLEERGELVVTGRVKDVIFVDGQTLNASDVEWQAAEAGGLDVDAVAAVGFTDEHTGVERVVVFVRQRGEADYDALHRLGRDLHARIGFRPDYVLPIRRLPKTTSGKVQRHTLAARVRDGEAADEVVAYEAAAERWLRGPAAPVSTITGVEARETAGEGHDR